MTIDFVRVVEADLPRLYAWLQLPHVREFYFEADNTVEGIRHHYLPAIRGDDPSHPYFARIHGVPIGYLQTYLIDDHPAYARVVDVGAGAAGVDMLIGDPAHVHRGLGATLLRQFVDDVVWPVTGARTCWIGPAVHNKIAIRAYEKAGFVYVKTVPGEAAPEYMMMLGRP